MEEKREIHRSGAKSDSIEPAGQKKGIIHGILTTPFLKSRIVPGLQDVLFVDILLTLLFAGAFLLAMCISRAAQTTAANMRIRVATIRTVVEELRGPESDKISMTILAAVDGLETNLQELTDMGKTITDHAPLFCLLALAIPAIAQTVAHRRLLKKYPELRERR
jgi:hypothetical protein